jgi:2-succinyl-5-enolpyruvyl-6-hydroxy-3-cyclohexene-1-carboxylate synthase
VNPAGALAHVLVDELVRHGVREVVLCPGSRSAPLAYAVQQAERDGRLRLHVRVDERSAGFLALGLAKAAGLPAVVLTTSGTAVANLHPAVLEAHHGVVPLLLISADRPPELRGTGANQTTSQPGVFSGAVRWSHDLGTPDERPGQPPGWRSTVARAFAAAAGQLGGTPGPVHLNMPLREPLVPTDGEWPESLDGRPDGEPWTRIPTLDDRNSSREERPSVAPVERTLVVVGDLPRPEQSSQAVKWARRRGWPVMAEPFGAYPRADVVPHGSLLLTAQEWLARHEPERVLVVGRITLSRAVAALLRRPGVRLEIVSPVPDWADPWGLAAAVHPWHVVQVEPETDRAVSWVAAGSWRAAWESAGAAVASAIAAAGLPWPSGPAVAAQVAEALPPGALLFAGSSAVVRDLDLAASAWPADVLVAANRGLAGIDGCVSTSAGLALGGDRPAYALLGDLTFLHDANGLLIGPAEPRPDLTIVVANDDGGGLFTLLEPGEPALAGDFERVFGTPTGTDLSKLCEAHGVRHHRVATARELAGAVAAPPAGLAVVEVQIDRAGHRRTHDRLRAIAAEALRT